MLLQDHQDTLTRTFHAKNKALHRKLWGPKSTQANLDYSDAYSDFLDALDAFTAAFPREAADLLNHLDQND